MTPPAPGPERRVDPPLLARWIVSVALPERYRDNQLGDLAEEFRALAETRGEPAARRWYWSQAVASTKSNLTLRMRARPIRTKKGNTTMGTIWQDIRYGARGLVRNPGYGVISALTLAMAIGVNTAIFSLVSILAFADLPMQDPDGMAFVWMTDANTGRSQVSVSPQDLFDLRDNRSFESLAGLSRGSAILSGSADPIRVGTAVVTDNLWDTWQVPMAIGRGFLPGEDQPGAAPVVILAHGFWQERYASSPDVLGRTLRVNGREHTVVGVAPPVMEFGRLSRASIWQPLGEPRTGGDREDRRLMVSGRLRPGVTIEQASEEMAAIGRRLSEQHPETNTAFGVHVLDTKTSLMGENLPTIFLLMTLSVSFVLLIACANVANMLLARSTSRVRELAVRAALGAGRLRIVRQLLTESVLVSVAAGLMGLGLAHGMMSLMVFITRGQEVLFTMATLNREVLIFTLIVTMAAPLVFGLLPALRASHADVSSTLKEGSARSGGGRRGDRIRGALVVSQVSLALILMILAGVGTRTVMVIQTLDRGFEGSSVLSMIVELPEGDYADDERVSQFFDELLINAAAISDAEAVALVSSRPGFSSEERFEIEGRAVVDDRDQPRAARTVASPDYLDVLRIPLFQGRGLAARDTEGTLEVALVNRAAADKYWPGEDPVGRRIRLGSESESWLQIVGVAGGTEFSPTGQSLEHVAQLYLPAAQQPRRTMTLMVRTRTRADHRRDGCPRRRLVRGSQSTGGRRTDHGAVRLRHAFR